MADATKYGTATGSALTGSNFDRTATAAGALETIAVSVPFDVLENDYVVVTNSEFGGVNPTTGTYTFVAEITSGDANLNLRVRVQRYNSSNSLQQSSSYTSPQTVSSAIEYTFSMTSVDLGTWAAGDYLAVNLEWDDTGAHGNGACNVEMDVAANNATRVVYPEEVAAGAGNMSTAQQNIRRNPTYRR